MYVLWFTVKEGNVYQTISLTSNVRIYNQLYHSKKTQIFKLFKYLNYLNIQTAKKIQILIWFKHFWNTLPKREFWKSEKVKYSSQPHGSKFRVRVMFEYLPIFLNSLENLNSKLFNFTIKALFFSWKYFMGGLLTNFPLFNSSFSVQINKCYNKYPQGRDNLSVKISNWFIQIW